VAAQPFIVNVTGLKKSGKTTVAEAILSELAGRGRRAGALKTARHETLTLDPQGTDTRRFAEAGAEFVVALLDGETHYFERRRRRSTVREASRLFPEGVEFIVCEGSVEPELAPLCVVCLRAASDLEETLSVRSVPREAVLALSGPAAAGPLSAPFPAFDATDPRGRSALVDLILSRSGGSEGRGRAQAP
jgi:molybdopterin-guanine dinucleotide biosynthesis protein MobB